MARPTENTTIANSIIIGIAIQMMGFPITITTPSPLVPIQRLIAATTRMVMTIYSTLASTTCDPPANFNIAIRKCHFKPPIRDNRKRIILPIKRMSRPLSNRRWGSRIKVWAKCSPIKYLPRLLYRSSLGRWYP